MKEIRFHGRGGQGAVTAAQILAKAAFIDGSFAQAFPYFGVERRGAPLLAFTRIDNKKIRIRSQIYEPDFVVVQDPSLIDVMDITSGLKEGGTILVNTTKEMNFEGYNTVTVDATGIALEVLGLPIVNTSILGAFVGVTNEVSIEALKEAIIDSFPKKLAEKNAKAAEVAYNTVKNNI